MRQLLLVASLFATLRVVGQHTHAVVDTTLLHTEIVVTALRQPLDNHRLPRISAALDSTALRQQVARTVPETLTALPGVFVQKTNHGGGSPFLRGLTGQQALLLVDGIRVNNATTRSGPNQYLNTLESAWMAQAEVVLGSGSVEYGSDAIGGVVNVLTHPLHTSPTTQWRPEAAFKWTSGGMETGGHAAITGSGRRGGIRAEAAYRDFGDLIAGQGIGRQSPTAYTQWSYALKARWQLSERLTATAAWQDLEQQTVPVYHKVALENFAFNYFNPQRRNLGYVRLIGRYDTPWWRTVELTASRQNTIEGRSAQKNGSDTRTDETDRTLTHGLQANVHSQISPAWRMDTGAEYYADAVRSEKTEWNTATNTSAPKRGLYPDDARMTSLAVYHLHTWQQRRWTLTGGLRLNQFLIRVPIEALGGDTELTPRALVGNVGASWAATPALRIFANAATAFRAPNVDDLGTLGIVDFRYEVPNYNLAPEKSRSVEAGIKWKSNRLRGSVAGYHLSLNDLIGRTRTGDTLQGYPVFLKENIAQAYIQGINAHWDWQWHTRWTLAGHASYTYGQNETGSEPLRRIPPFNGRVQVRHQASERLWWYVESYWAGAQNRLASGDKSDNRINPDGTPAWWIANIGATYQWQQVTLTAEWHNLFNEAYRTHGSGVDGVGRSVWVRVGYRG